MRAWLVREQGLDSHDSLRVLTDKNVDDIYNIMRKPGGKNADGTPNRGELFVRTQEILKLAAFLFHHRWRCTFDWEIIGVDEETVHFLAGQKKLKDEYKDPNLLPKINKSDTAGMIESIKEYLRLHCGVIQAPLAYIIRKTITVQTHGDYPMYATPDDEMIARMLHLPQTRTNFFQKKMLKQYKHTQQSLK